MKKELKRMSRQELIEIIYDMKKTEIALRKELEEAQEKLLDRQLRVETAGSIAEAALSINRVMEAAQAAADDYLRSVKAKYPG